MSIINSIPNEWRLVIKQREQHIHPPLNDLFQIKIDGTDTPISKITSKSIYNEFKRKKKKNCSFCSKENGSEIPWPFGRSGKKSTLFRLVLLLIQRSGNFSTNY